MNLDATDTFTGLGPFTFILIMNILLLVADGLDTQQKGYVVGVNLREYQLNWGLRSSSSLVRIIVRCGNPLLGLHVYKQRLGKAHLIKPEHTCFSRHLAADQ